MTAGRVIEAEDELATLVRAIRTVAVVGMKDESRRDQPAFSIPERLVELGIEVIPVNPGVVSSLGRRAWPDLASVPGPFDTIDLFRRPDNVPAHVDEILALPAARRPKLVWMQTGIRHEESAARLVAAGLDVVMDRCLGVIASRYRKPAARGRP